MEGRQVRYRVEDGKAILTIDREQARNSLSPQVISELGAAVDALASKLAGSWRDR